MDVLYTPENMKKKKQKKSKQNQTKQTHVVCTRHDDGYGRVSSTVVFSRPYADNGDTEHIDLSRAAQFVRKF